MSLLDSHELDRRIAEAEAAMIKSNEIIDEPEVKESLIDSDEGDEEEIVEHSEEKEIEVEEEDIQPTDPKGWKKLREKKKAAQAQLEEEKKLREQKERELYELKERLARLEGREEARTKPIISQEEDVEPDRELDPDSHRDWKIKQLEKRTTDAEKRAEKAEAMAQVEGVRRGLKMVEREYTKTHNVDDYEARIEHIKNVERNLIRLRNPQATNEQINGHLEAERIRMANDAYSKGQNPAELFMKMSETLGYVKVKEEKGDGTKPDIGAINRNMKKNANLIGSSNVEKPGGLSSEKLVAMSISDLLDSKNEKALDQAIRREQEKWMAS